MGDKKINITEKTLLEIRRLIITGKLKPGTVITEESLSGDLNFSRGSVRTALKELEHEGLVYSSPTGRKEILGLNENFLKDLYEMREYIELTAVKTIFSKKYKSDSEYFQRVITPLSQALSFEDSPENRAASDAEFHQVLIDASENRALMQCWRVIKPVIWAMQDINAVYGPNAKNYETYVKELHEEIFKLLAEKDSAIFDKLHIHIDNARKVNTEIFSKLNS